MRADGPIKAIFFDLGGVIFQRDRMYARVLEAFAPEDSALFWDCYNSEAMPFCRGEINKSQFLRNLGAKVGRQIPDEVIQNLCEENFHDNRVIDTEVLSTIELLRKNYRLGLISNITEEFAEVARKMGVFALFDEVILSCRVGLSKDHEQIFTIALNRLGVAASESVFIDDFPLYVEVARSVGMHAVQFNDSRTLRRDLAALGVSV